MRTFLLSGEFLTRERLRLWGGGLIIATLAALVFLGVTAHGLNDFKGRPLGTDFSCIYTAGDMARHGMAQAAYDPERHNSALQEKFGAAAPTYGWFYPPSFFFVAAPLSHLPYLPALIVWQGATLLLYFLALWALLRNSPAPELACDPMWLLLALAFPAVFVNLTHGQNGFLSAALLAGGLAALRPKPILAGILFGLLAYKPQLGIALPFALLAGRQWKTVAAAAVTVLAIAALATASFGPGIWAAFLDGSQLSRHFVIEQGAIGFEKMQSLFGAVRLLGGSVAVAYSVQGVATAVTLIFLMAVWRGDASDAKKGAALVLASLLSTPYSLDYDLMLLAPAIALWASQGRARRFRSGELLILSALWLLPLFAREFASATHLALAPALIGLAFFTVLRRA